MTSLSFRPGPDFLEQAATAAWYFLDRCGVSEAGAHVVVPTAAQIPGVRQALDAAARAAGRPRLLPRVLTLGHWLLDLPPEGAPVRSPAARLLAVQQAVRGQDWLRRAFGAQNETAAWGLSQTLLAICDELSARWLEDAAIRDDDEVDGDDRAGLLQGALARTYAHLSERFLGEEARIVLAFWQALSGPDDPLPAKRRALRELSQQLRGPVVWIAPTPPTPLEAAFLRDAGELVPVLQVGYDWSGQDQGEAGWYHALLALWPESRIAGDDEAALHATSPAMPALPPQRPSVRVVGCARFEDEAAAAAAQLVQWLNEGRRQVALVAHDRVVARRARALLARAGAPVRDETGWKLSTTRAAAALMRWFDLLVRDGDTAALLDLLKSPFCLPDVAARGAAIALLERQVRREGITGGWARLRQMFAHAPANTQQAAGDDEEAEQAPRRAARALIAVLADEAARWPRGFAQHPLATWLERLDGMLDGLGMRAALAADDAGSQLLDALARLQELPRDETGGHATLSQGEFRAMLSALLESVAYKEPSGSGPARITILPLNGARMRRFEGVVIVGCDDAQLPSSAAELMFFSNQMRRELDLEDREARFAQQARDLAEVLLNNDDVVLTWQRYGSRGEPHHVSGWIERLAACCARAGVSIEGAAVPQAHETFADVRGMPAPAAEPALVPVRWSAQAYNALRRCPYQFFAGRMLGLAGLETVSDELEKRDIGETLHRVLLTYHKELQARRERGETPSEDQRLARLGEISDEVFGALMAEDGNAIAYYRRWREVLPSYVAWQSAREAEGWFWRGGELDAGIDLPMPDGQPLRLTGRIDRLDQGPGGAHAVLDYKTQSATRLKRKLAEVEEDCQLPFYGLLRADAAAGSWVSLEGAREGAPAAQREVALPDFEAAVTWLERQMRDDVMRLRQGARLPAFGDASACVYCTARGLCRKGFWDSTAVPALTS
ncbi:Putative helicase, C_term RecB family exonuclease [Cupriavidus taiwanensis]|uniref:PD-(D/E)XK nuclease family protein n=1 Tax=Cupriavidus taiwanensis TaxID=164546 RepID=UPI000E143024|nr:PD-(D/E)XK nuclease family protein [Cupriavidus taiwanensis]SOY79824.1 Putative helicase, C_term RecB family exonuclease [Cupriavidus taiwanensis]SOY81793.1 Putative helicase, C_term RecB family exonuclease [Cupriavidus taiwanensis]